MLSAREGRSAYDWPAWVRRLQEMPPGMPRLEAIKGELEVDDLVRLAKDHFVQWSADAMYDAAREGAILVEVRLGAEWVKWPELMPRFREAERQVQASYPGFCAEAIMSGVRTAQSGVIEACLDAREAGLAGIDLSRPLTTPKLDGPSGRSSIPGRSGPPRSGWASPCTSVSSRPPTSAAPWVFPGLLAWDTPSTRPSTPRCWTRLPRPELRSSAA